MNNINFVTVIIVLILIIPVLSGAFEYFSRDRIHRLVFSLFDNLEFLLGVLLSIFLVRKIFIEHSAGFYAKLYRMIPESIKSTFAGQDVMTYIVLVPLVLLLIMVILRLISLPLYRIFLVPLADRTYSLLESTSDMTRRIISAISKIPKAFFGVLIFGLLLNFYTYYFYTPKITDWMNESQAYQFLYKNALYPVLNSNLAKQIPVIVNDSFRKTFDKVIPVPDSTKSDAAKKFAKELEKRNIKVIEYFNGVTLDEAIKSNNEIDSMAKKIVGDEKDSYKKGYLIYRWISKNIKYDYEKAEAVSKDPRGVQSGAINAYETRKGICFDYSSLYVAMCRAVGLKVRLVTGLGYSGVMWGDHAWNQVYSSSEKRWIDVDCTFGVSGKYFDKKDFNVDHKDADIQGDW
ncbi:MAG: transglutaminase-like domain-containing protein [Clostridia bacterium]|nr:transglutaminase-like domain-containing protein [Clostridia bacterium]